MNKNDFAKYVVLTAILSIGIALAGYAIGGGFVESKLADRYVTVKGLAEKEADADLAIWPITFNVMSNGLSDIQGQVEENRVIIKEFLLKSGFEEKSVSYAAPKIFDNEADGYSNRVQQFRYRAQSTVTVRSDKVSLVKTSMEKSGALIGKGVVMAQNWEFPTEFIYTALNEIKPSMIEEATKNARMAAEKFAMDSGSEVGKIRNATQGLFSIDNRDMNSPERKVIRVVTTVQYYLVDN
ncbi:MAG: SIMPL domain-containing protein [Bacteroidetes bacterium]|nr:SIMPL domain-containing protein [Bacteroidota bacterium]